MSRRGPDPGPEGGPERAASAAELAALGRTVGHDDDDLGAQLDKAKVAAALFGEAPLAPKIGRFTILERIGAGGMGEVFAAYDERLDRRVALKLVRPDSASEDAEQRLLKEARALAQLSHPNVVQVYEAGPFEDRVFVAMEFLGGAPLHRWAASETSWRARLDALIQAGRGLSAAHLAGLVHRDVKPSNILVGEDGRVSVIDFGLAHGGDRTPQAAAGTPPYMAPELATTGATAKSDQFGFAAAAFEILYGRRPFPDDALPYRVGHAHPPEIPSDADVPAWVGQAIRRGLATDPAERFEDLEALLTALGRDPTARRRRIAGASALLAAGLGLGAAGVFGVQAATGDPCEASDAALHAVWSDEIRAQTKASLLGTGLPFADAVWRSAAATLDGYGEGWTAAHRGACEATHVTHEQSPAVLDRRMACLDHRRRALAAAVEIFASAPREALERPNQVLASLPELAICADARLWQSGLTPAPSRAVAEQLDRLRNHLARAEARLTVADGEGAGRQLGAAAALVEAVDDGAARGEYERVAGLLELHRSHRKAGVERLKRAIRLAIVHRHDELALDAWLALVRRVGGDSQAPDVAAGWIQQAEAFLLRVTAPEDRRRVDLEHARGLVAISAGRYREAIDIFSRALEATNPDRPAAWNLRFDRASAHLSLGEAKAARDDYERLLPLYAARWGASHPKVGLTYLALGQLAIEHLGDLDRAEVWLTRALRIFEGAFGSDSLRVAQVHGALALLGQYRGQYRVALQHAERSLQIETQRLGQAHPRTATTRMNVGAFRHLDGDYLGAVEAYRAALEVLQAKLGPEHDDVGTACSNLGESLLALGETKQARPYFARALHILEASLGPEHPDLAYPLKGLGLAELALGRPRAAARALERASGLTPAKSGDPRERADIAWGLARALRADRRNPSRARALALEAQRIYRALDPTAAQPGQQIEAWLTR